MLAIAPASVDADVISIYQSSGRQFDDLNGGSPTDGTLSGEFPATSLFAQRSSSVTTRRFGLEFSLASLPVNALITSAVFTAAENADAGGGSLIYGRAGNGTVDVADLFDFTNLLGGIGSGAGNGVLANVNLDVTTFVQSLVTSNETYLALSFAPAETSTNASFSIRNFDGNGPQIDPRLTINYEIVPEVNSLVLLATASTLLLGIASHRRRHSSRKP
jgi:hypothetical protein